MKTVKKFLLKGVGLALIAVLAACSASSNSSDDTGSSGGSGGTGSSAVKGNVTLSGAVTVSDTAQKQASSTVDGASARSLRLQELTLKERHQAAVALLESTGAPVINSVDDESIVPMEGGTIYVSYLDSNGDIVSTDITAEISPTGSYSIPNLKDGVTYVLTAEKVGFDADGNINKIKTEAIAQVE